MRAHAACAGSLPFELPEGRLAVFAPGANEEQRRFSAAPTLQVFSQFAGMGLNVVLVGAPADRPLASSLAAAASVPVADLTGRTGVQELAEILRRAEIVVTEDSGPAHIAAALRRPPAGLYGASLAPLTTAPWGAGHLVLVAGAMEAFSSELVMAAIRTRLGMAADAELRPEALRATAQVWRTAMLTGGADPLRISGPRHGNYRRSSTASRGSPRNCTRDSVPRLEAAHDAALWFGRVFQENERELKRAANAPRMVRQTAAKLWSLENERRFSYKYVIRKPKPE